MKDFLTLLFVAVIVFAPLFALDAYRAKQHHGIDHEKMQQYTQAINLAGELNLYERSF